MRVISRYGDANARQRILTEIIWLNSPSAVSTNDPPLNTRYESMMILLNDTFTQAISG